MAAAYHLRLVQPVVRLFARLFRRPLRLSGAEALGGAANVFFGVEAATTVRPYLDRMTRSELLTVLTCGMSTVASTTLAVYVLFLQGEFPRIAGHLVSASVLSIPAAALMSKLILPETERPETLGRVPDMGQDRPYGNTMAALSGGAWDGLRLAAGIATLLIAVLGVVALADLLLARITAPAADALGGPLDLRRLLGWVFTPAALLLGIEWNDLGEAGRVLGERIILTEVVAYRGPRRAGPERRRVAENPARPVLRPVRLRARRLGRRVRRRLRRARPVQKRRPGRPRPESPARRHPRNAAHRRTGRRVLPRTARPAGAVN